jgi:hypothetical protein
MFLSNLIVILLIVDAKWRKRSSNAFTKCWRTSCKDREGRRYFIHFSKTQNQVEKTVKQESEEILEDAERLKINREEIRRMLREAFNTRTISESYLRRLLPDEYKYDAKTRLDYKVKQKLEPKLDQQTTDYSKEVSNQIPYTARQEGLWTAIGILEMSRNQIPLKITVNPKERKIEYVEVDREAMKNAKHS